jgi:hypothetical protein
MAIPSTFFIYFYCSIVFLPCKEKNLSCVEKIVMGILLSKGGILMKVTKWAITLGLGAAAGAVAIMMMPTSNPTRRLAAKAANKVEDTACKMGDAISNKLDDM